MQREARHQLLEHDQRKLEQIRRELAEVGAQVRSAVEAIYAGSLPGSVLVQGMRAQDPLPPGPAPKFEKLESGGSIAWLGPRNTQTAILYCHGGGGVSGSVNGHRDRMEKLGALAGSRVCAVEYRLAPEHPFPSDIEDAIAAYRLLLESGISPSQIALAGDSHGAGVIMATLLKLRDDDERLPAAAFLACGVYDRTVVLREGFLEQEVTWELQDPVLSFGPFLRWLCETYLAGEDPSSSLASPLLADHAGLPPLLLQAGEMEVLRGQSERLARSVARAGGDVTLDLAPDMFHNFHAYPLRQAEAAVERAASFLRTRLRG